MSVVTARTTARSWFVWGSALLGFVVAVCNRTSLGVAAAQATERFGIGPSQFALFAVVQVFVYAGLQVPVGVVLDRVGPRLMITVGLVVMSCGQVAMAFAQSSQLAIGARVLVGAGDAMIFISVARLVPSWFSPEHVPIVTQLSGQFGQVGQILSAVPFVAVLAGPGWSAAYLSAAAIGVLIAALVVIVVRDRQPGLVRPVVAASLRAVTADVRAAFHTRGTQLGFWSHFTVQYSAMAFTLMWGYPFMVSGLGLGQSAAGALMSVMVLGSAVSGPILGRLTAAFPFRRSNLVLLEVAATILVWTAVLAWPGTAPVWLVVLLVLVLSVNGPTSMVGLDFARTFNPISRLGSATGIVNMGGYIATLLTIWLVGVVLQARGGAFSLANFKVAFCVQYVIWAFGLAMVIRARVLIRREHGSPPDHFHTALWRHRPGRRRNPD